MYSTLSSTQKYLSTISEKRPGARMKPLEVNGRRLTAGQAPSLRSYGAGPVFTVSVASALSTEYVLDRRADLIVQHRLSYQNQESKYKHVLL